ncbi:MAG: asparagine synthase (glutamine-hydrolyzing) [Granulosicoccus sp.]
MCGIAGFIRPTASSKADYALLERMSESLRHRGPDAGAIQMEPAAAEPQVGFCHRRLSIIDLSEGGLQPMTSGNDRYVIVFNGEIYNYLDLRAELANDGVQFRGASDTEVLLELFAREGPACLHRLNGMFAIAIWDKVEKSLFLARDRLGKKPLYLYRNNGECLFASEIKAILCAPFVDREIDYEAVKDYFAYQYVPDPKSIFRHVRKLRPGYWMRICNDHIEEHQYWDVSFANPHSQNADQLVDELYSLLDDSVRIRMISDVPLGAFLSGGVDSSAVVALMAKHSSKPVTTCTIGFDSERYDEVAAARSTAEWLGTDHHEFTAKSTVEQQLLEIAASFDEPFSDPSFVPTWYVSRMARQQVTVALAGDGGDENFAGYAKYQTDQTENRLRNAVPEIVRKNVFPTLAGFLSSWGFTPARRGASLLNSLSKDPDEAFFITNSFFDRKLWDELAIGELKTRTQDYDPSRITTDLYQSADSDEHLSRLLYTDLKSYLPGDILVKVDRMSMANSLETRAPLLDYRLVEFAAKVPASLKLHGKESKYLLKQCSKTFLKADILTRKKMGFSVPLADWLRQELKPLAEQTLFANDSGLSEMFDINGIREIWNEHQSASRDRSSEIWSLFMFELWWQCHAKP